MRVISGFLKGRIIEGYNIKGTRPTMARVKESIFSSIQNDIQGAICLDLFSGSGSLGIEAISNGAKYCYFIDNNKEVIKQLTKTINNFKINDKVMIKNMDYKDALSLFSSQKIKFDLIFVDPPYDYKIIDSIINLIIKNDLLSLNGKLILEFRDDILNDNYDFLKLIKNKKYKDKYVFIYQKVID